MTETAAAQPRTRRRLVVVAALALAALLVGAGVWFKTTHSPIELADGATITAGQSTLGSSPESLVDTGSASSPGKQWSFELGVEGAWVQISWPAAQRVSRVVIVNGPVSDTHVQQGFFSFGDGSSLQTRLSDSAAENSISFTPRDVTSLRFTVSALSGAATRGVLAEVIVYGTAGSDGVEVDSEAGGNSAVAAEVSASASTDSSPSALKDGSEGAGGAAVGASWSAPATSDAWVQLAWDRPRELSSVQVFGDKSAGASVVEGRLEFSDGSTMTVGGVAADPDLPTTVAFMPRVTTSVRFVITGTSGAGLVSLSELRAFQVNATPARPDLAPTTVEPKSVAPACTPPSARPARVITAYCPVGNSEVGDDVTVKFVAPGVQKVSGRVVSGESGSVVPPTQEVAPGAQGLGELTFALNEMPPGPLTVQLTAPGASSATYLQLYRSSGSAAAGDVRPTALSVGKTLAYSEEFSSQVSLSRDGSGAVYAAAKPVRGGAEDFGDAVFPDPRLGYDTVSVIDDRFLRLAVEPLPDGYADPQKWNRKHIGGMLSSARSGGSGFSAQYGYFEARMLLPTGTGTWPAFWMLPSPDLAAKQSLTAEIDAMEAYGHEPQQTCTSTHAYTDGGQDRANTKCDQRFADVSSASQWHTYGARVTPTEIQYYVDGKLVQTLPQVPGGGDAMFFMVNLALGGGWPVQLDNVGGRAAAYVDYVRVYA